MTRTLLKDIFYLFLCGGALFFIFWDLAAGRVSFLSGDHLIQHYPWAGFLQDRIRAFSLPWWTSQIQSGFPLLAEGQIGAFYFPNLLFLFFLPLKWAYNYEVLFHYALGGLFFYGYLRSWKLSSEAVFFATLIFLFGSTNGGFFYNITSQRVSVWFPLSLYLVDGLFSAGRLQKAIGLALIFSFQIFAGYFQIAVYCIAFTSLYFCLRLVSLKKTSSDEFLKPVAAFLVSIMTGACISAIQWVPTLRLASLSSRAGAVRELAYEGSASPLGFMTLFFPEWTGFWRGGFYVGILGIFFAALTLFKKKSASERIWWFLLIFSLLLAWGRYSPLYLFIVQIFKIYFFRVPAKFLFFSAFSLAVLSAHGLDYLMRARHDTQFVMRAYQSLSLLFVILTAGILIGHFGAKAFKEPLSQLLEDYTRKNIYGKPFHPHSMEIYKGKIQSYFDYFLGVSSLSARETWVPILFFVSQMVGLRYVIFRKSQRGIFIFCLVFIFLDLAYSCTKDIRTDLYPYDLVKSKSKIISKIKDDPDIFRVHLFNTDTLQSGVFPFMANQNMLFGFDVTGVYSPLTFRGYKQLMGYLGGVDDSLFALPAKVDFLKRNFNLLKRLNVKYVLSNVQINEEQLEPIFLEDAVWLYKVKEYSPRFYFVKKIKKSFKEGEIEPLSPEVFRQGYYSFDLKGKGPGYVVVNEQNYAGWKAKDKANLFNPLILGPCMKAFPVSGDSGRFEVFYAEKDKDLLYGVSGTALFLCLLVGQLFRRKRKKSPSLEILSAD